MSVETLAMLGVNYQTVIHITNKTCNKILILYYAGISIFLAHKWIFGLNVYFNKVMHW